MDDRIAKIPTYWQSWARYELRWGQATSTVEFLTPFREVMIEFERRVEYFDKRIAWFKDRDLPVPEHLPIVRQSCQETADAMNSVIAELRAKSE